MPRTRIRCCADDSSRRGSLATELILASIAPSGAADRAATISKLPGLAGSQWSAVRPTIDLSRLSASRPCATADLFVADIVAGCAAVRPVVVRRGDGEMTTWVPLRPWPLR